MHLKNKSQWNLREKAKYTVLLKDFNSPLTNRAVRQKMNMDIDDVIATKLT